MTEHTTPEGDTINLQPGCGNCEHVADIVGVEIEHTLHDRLAEAWDQGAKCRAAHPASVSVKTLNPYRPAPEATAEAVR